MNPAYSLLRPFLFAGLAAASLTIAAAEAPPSRVSVEWSDVASLSETKEAHGRGWQRGEAWLVDLRKHLQRSAERVLPPGDRLDVTITDIKLAGAYEPWRGSRYDDVRIVKDIYPPRIDLKFVLSGADGRVIAEGERKLRDPGFLTRTIANTSDPLRYEKRLLDEWLRNELTADARKAP
ncbi:MAG TPA: DUF3016 domain-containing protein [Dokdonella sp.]|uniref:DUF3016 domain-containing protein n=1 Tax=Dokdonella sp. TaxID=2291710 RepID=UPI0025C37E86|nr:DUF3016 domain-containing protein [Dokdonella sp.]MBX3691830.1 DUF3016 domain-containing protein [Dokdonella sp.]MCW5568939.1 DUF3016 domain-containing protein [Dokdonella sp.]HNR92380.1 DUF3016 domain-containing protein [Dokdonella sp.]